MRSPPAANNEWCGSWREAVAGPEPVAASAAGSGAILPWFHPSATGHLERVGDADIWAYAKQHGFTIVTKDADFAELALLRGYPPKVIWLNCGNVSNATVRRKLLDNAETIQRFIASVENGVLEIE